MEGSNWDLFIDAEDLLKDTIERILIPIDTIENGLFTYFYKILDLHNENSIMSKYNSFVL